MRSARMGVALLIILSASGCALFASKAELRLVEQMSTNTDPIVRADALGEYDTRFGERGHLRERTETMRNDIDEAFWHYAMDGGLEQPQVEDYIARFPSGNHRGEADRRLDQLRYFAEADAAREQARLDAEEAERQRVAEQNEAQRQLVNTGLDRWLRTALSVPRWGTTLPVLIGIDDDLRAQWNGDPEPICVRNTCRKTLDATYFFSREGATRVDRTISLVLQIDMNQGRVFQITGYYTGRGFVDWLEMGAEQPIVEETVEDREMARDAMMAVFRGTVATALPGATEIETEDAGVLLRFRHEQIQVSLMEFPATFTAGRVDGFQVTFQGELASTETPTPDEE